MNQPVTMDDVAKYHLAESAAWQQIARDSQDSGQRESAQRKTDWHLQAAAEILTAHASSSTRILVEITNALNSSDNDAASILAIRKVIDTHLCIANAPKKDGV